jgi:hypothetical protein
MELGREAIGLSTGIFGDGGIAGIGRLGITTEAGEEAKSGSGAEVGFTGCTVCWG